MRAIPRKSRSKTPTTQREEQGAEKEGDHRNFDACPRRRLHHRRILAFVPTNLPNRDIQAKRKHNIVLEGQWRRVQQKTAPRQRAVHPAAPEPQQPSPPQTRARRSSRRALRRRVSSAVDPRSTSIRPCPFGHIGDGNIHYNLTQPIGMVRKILWQDRLRSIG